MQIDGGEKFSLTDLDEAFAKIPLRFFSPRGGCESKTGQMMSRLDAAIWFQRALQGHETDDCDASESSS